MNSTHTASVEEGSSYAGWLAGTLAILAILGVGAFLWFTHHPY